MNEENQTMPENNSEGTTLMVSETEAPTGAESQVQSEATQGQQGAEPPAAGVQDGAPEQYEFIAPEGNQYDQGTIEAFSAAAKEANLSQEKAQKLLETMSPKLAERQIAQIAEVQKHWTESSKADKEFGGEKLGENLGVAKKALDQFGTPELKSLLEESGLGNHPEVVRFFYRAGKAISEDGFVGGRKADGTVKDPARILFTTMEK